jgi:assimilatory nitrate reductase catalytic subunit
MQSPNALNYHDVAKGAYRSALIENDHIQQIVFISEQPDLPSRAWLATLFQEPIDAATRRALLAGRPMDASNDVGEIICSCFGVGKNTIEKAIHEQKLCSPEEIGKCLKAGTNCGSCVPELRNILKASSTNVQGRVG